MRVLSPRIALAGKRPTSRSLLLALFALSSGPAFAQPGMWGAPGWGPRGGPGENRPRSAALRDAREGRVEVEQFIAENANAPLGQGHVVVAVLPGTTTGARDQATYEAAVIDQLVKTGYNTLPSNSEAGQVAEIRVVRDVVVPEEAKRSPVSGSMAVGVSNRGSMTAMAINVDLTKPKKALISTRLEVRLRDRGSDQLLWEGRASIITREGDSHWDEQAISNRLAGALFEKLPAARSHERSDGDPYQGQTAREGPF